MVDVEYEEATLDDVLDLLQVSELQNEVATALIATQTGQHRLGSVALTDGRDFLSADVLLQPELFANQMVGVEYQEATLDDVRDLLPVSDLQGEE